MTIRERLEKLKKKTPAAAKKKPPAKADHAESPGAALVAMRWAKTTKAQRSALAQKLNHAQGRGLGPRCPCGNMTLKRATARGIAKGHKRGCTFYKK